MVIKTKIDTIDNWLFEVDVPDTYTPGYRFLEKEADIKNKNVNIETRYLTTGGLFVMYSTMKLSQPLNIETVVEGETITSQFVFYRKMDTGLHTEAANAGHPANILYGRSRHNLHYIPSTHKSYLLKENIEYTYFLVVVSKDYYFNLVDRQSVLHEDFAGRIASGIYTSLTDEDLYVTYEMRRVIENMINCDYKNEMKRIHTEAHIIELLMYQLEQLKSNDEQAICVTVNSNELEKLEIARKILEQRFADPPTQKELSRVACLNEFKLRRGFKEYYGTTIYDYVTRLRMEHARKLLTCGNCASVCEVALQVGFSHQNNFSAAFKKYFGVSPKDLAVA
ncbi:MAG: AraC family transcriptional regulator [Chitinophagaceae bacterium]